MLVLLGLLLIVAVILFAWMRGLAKDDGGKGRPVHGAYTWPAPSE